MVIIMVKNNDNCKSCKTGRAGSSPEFHVNFGSDRVGSLQSCVGRVGSNQDSWTHV